MNGQLNKNRLFQCLKRDLILNGKTFMIWLGAAIAIIALGIPINQFLSENPGGLYPHYIAGHLLFFFGSLFLVSQAFQEVHNQGTALFYLTLPASAMEKLLSAWLIRTLGFILTFYILTWLFTGLMAMVMKAFSQLESEVMFNPLHLTNLKYAGHLMILHAVFLLGSLSFRQNAFIHTLLRIIGFCFLLFVLSALITLLFYEVSSTEFFFAKAFSSTVVLTRPDLLGMQGIYTALYGLAGLFFLIVSYLRLKEITA